MKWWLVLLILIMLGGGSCTYRGVTYEWKFVVEKPIQPQAAEKGEG